MRIRKRLALCSIPTTAPLLDLHLRRSEAAPPSRQPPDQHSRWGFPKNEEKMKQKQLADDDDNTNNDIRKIVHICDGGQGFNTNLQESWCDEDYKLVPLKKRKGIFERNPNEEHASAKMKSKTNKKCVVPFDSKTVMIEGNGMNMSCSSGGAKKSKRGNVIMEGSRCSRVNGRGWRCCQPTLVGYSLCEHHLGKGRLRSMAVVRRPHPTIERDPQPLLVATKKRSKVGVVKARSMSSLLSQI